VFGDVVLDGLLQLPDIAKDAAPHALARITTARRLA
jgi:hypothetical protein